MKTCVMSKCIDCGEIKMLSKRKARFADAKVCDSCGSRLVILNQYTYGIDLSNSKDITGIVNNINSGEMNKGRGV